MRITTRITSILLILALAACGQNNIYDLTYLPEKNGKERYSLSGLVMVPKYTPEVTKPYIESAMAKSCPNGIRYESFSDELNKKMGISEWAQYNAIVECK